MEIADLIAQRLEAKGKLFVSKTEFYQLLGVELRRKLGVTAQSTKESLAMALRTHGKDRFRLAQGGRTVYVAFNLADEEFLRDKAKRLTTFTVGQLAMNLPLPKVRVPLALTTLLTQGEVVCIAIKKDFVPVLQWVKTRQAKQEEVAAQPEIGNEDQEFWQACQEIGQGRNFIPIHRLRSHLGWERSRFDQVLVRLRGKERILMNMGDPTKLSAEEIQNSFQDDNGMLYLTLNWLESRS